MTTTVDKRLHNALDSAQRLDDAELSSRDLHRVHQYVSLLLQSVEGTPGVDERLPQLLWATSLYATARMCYDSESEWSVKHVAFARNAWVDARCAAEKAVHGEVTDKTMIALGLSEPPVEHEDQATLWFERGWGWPAPGYGGAGGAPPS